MKFCTEILTVTEGSRDSLTLSVGYVDHNDDKGEWSANEQTIDGRVRSTSSITSHHPAACRGTYNQQPSCAGEQCKKQIE
jgi:hypothetical protein